MDIFKIVIIILGLSIATVGVRMVYDARNITTKWFSFGDRNDAIRWMKIFGFIIAIIGGLMLFFNF